VTKKTKQPSSMAADIMGVVREGTKKWTRTVKAEERSPATRPYRFARMTREHGVSFKEAAAEIMEEAYMKVSGGGSLPANARQIMYAARPHIQKVTGKPLDDDYFTQTLLPDYVDEHGVDWNVVFDARGHFAEPHKGIHFGVGTLEVRGYLHDHHDAEIMDEEFKLAHIKTCGPNGNFGAVLFIEKEGFDPILREAGIANKFDIAIMSTKGLSVTAARQLADEMCSDHDIPLLTLHDFDKAGFSIAGTLQRDTRRYAFQNGITTIDLGLRLEDIQAMGLESEYQYLKGNKHALMANLRENGATEDEIAFMFADFDTKKHSARRVELNAMTSPQFIAFIERKLTEHGIKKIVPDDDLLSETYKALAASRRLEEIIAEAIKDAEEEDNDIPDDLADKVAAYLKENPTVRWDAAIASILKDSE
jgi:hypothetical protein